MRNSIANGVRFAGVASAVPDKVIATTDDAATFGETELRKIARSTGIKSRRVAPPGICTSDLCLAATERLLPELGWNRDTIDTLIFVSQTPDYVLPATSCSLHGRLGLSPSCAAFDVNLGCSGYTYGLWLGSHLIASGASRRVLLLAGEIASRPVYPLDRSARPLFGDAGTATALEALGTSPPIWFRVGTDGTGQNNLMIPAGGFRMRSSPGTKEEIVGSDGNPRTLDCLYMNGAEIFLFTLDRVPALIEATLSDAGWAMADVDAFVFHQANRFMLEHLGQAMGLPPEKLVLALEEFGNTSSASIPLAITVRLAERIRGGPMKIVLAGFGVGYSWAAAALQVEAVVAPDLVVVDTSAMIDELATSGTSHLPPAIQEQIRAVVR